MARGWIRTNNIGIKSPIENCCTDLIQDPNFRALPLSYPHRIGRLFCAVCQSAEERRLYNENTQGWQDSNLQIWEPKSHALPFGDTPLLPDVYDPTNAISFTLSTYTCCHLSGGGRFRWRISLPLSAQTKAFQLLPYPGSCRLWTIQNGRNRTCIPGSMCATLPPVCHHCITFCCMMRHSILLINPIWNVVQHFYKNCYVTNWESGT